MSASSPKLPGRLGDPSLSLATDPRLDPRLLEDMSKMGVDETSEEPPIGIDAPYREVVEFINELESALDPAYVEMFGSLPPVPGVNRRSEVVKGVDGNEIRLYIHEPADRQGPLPGILHTHGGGMAVCAASDPQYVYWRDELAARGVIVVGPEFRNAGGKLGPHPFPAGLNDCATATQWTHAHKDALGISKIIVSGESGGGNLCLATGLKAHKEGWIDQIAGVYSCCPFISGTWSPPPPELVSLRENEGYALGNVFSQLFAMAYDPTGEHAQNPLAWPYQAKVEELTGLPPHTVSVNELDPLRDEGLGYARKLMAAGVPTISRTVNGTHHGGDTEYLNAIPHVYRATIRDIQGFAASL